MLKGNFQMAARANIVINDGQATPVAHTFGPNSGDGNVIGVSRIDYEDRSGGIVAGFPVISVSTRKPTKANTNHKVVFKIVRPVLENVTNSTVNGIAPAPTVAYDVVFEGSFVLPSRSSIDVRKDILAYAKNLLAHATVTSAVQDLESPW